MHKNFGSKYEMTNEWIKFEDRMPVLDKDIEVKFYHGTIIKTKLIHDGNFIFRLEESKEEGNEGYPYCQKRGNFDTAIEWRNIEENKPDFNKLKEGDIIYIEYEDIEPRGNKNITSKFSKIYDGWMHLLGSCTYSIKISAIKKIILVNIEKKEFKDIYNDSHAWKFI